VSTDLSAHLIRLELELHQAEVRADGGRLGALLHPEFAEFGRSGQVWTRQAVLDEFTAASSPSAHPRIHAEGFALQQLSDDVALLTYRSAHVDEAGAQSRWTLRSSLWQRCQGRWVMRFHQGTPVPQR
jgi:hypothetical protein